MIDHLSNSIVALHTFNGFLKKGGLRRPYVHHTTYWKHGVPRQGHGKRKRYANFRGYFAAADPQ